MINISISRRSIRVAMVFLALGSILAFATPGLTIDKTNPPRLRVVEELDLQIDPSNFDNTGITRRLQFDIQFDHLGAITVGDHTDYYAFVEVLNFESIGVDEMQYLYIPNFKIFNVLSAAFTTNRHCTAWVYEISRPDGWSFEDSRFFRVAQAETGEHRTQVYPGVPGLPGFPFGNFPGAP